MIRIKRSYEGRARRDGQRILVERLWPRGMKKEALHADRPGVVPTSNDWHHRTSDATRANPSAQ